MIKKIIIATFLSSLFSCFNKNADNSTQTKSPDLVIGSTLNNINNSEYSGLKFEIDNKICLATINQYFKNYKDKKHFPLSLWVTVETLKKNDDGHPTGTEATLFNNLEDELINDFISKGVRFCFIGRTTRDGYREIMFYVSDEARATGLMNSFIKENAFKRKIEFAIAPDPEWESVSGFY